jgi:hypothetical protein
MRKIRGSRVPLRAARPGWSVLSCARCKQRARTKLYFTIIKPQKAIYNTKAWKKLRKNRKNLKLLHKKKREHEKICGR